MDRDLTKPREGSPTLNAIADRLGISVSTVSRALRRSQLVSEATRMRVLAVANELNYPVAPEPTLGPNAIGICLPRPTMYALKNPYFHEVIRGAFAGVDKATNGAWIISVHDIARLSADVLKSLRGVLLTSPEETNFDYQLVEEIPHVVLNSSGPASALSVTVNEEYGSHALTQHLLILGHERIGFIGKRSVFSSIHRFAGYRSALLESGMTTSDDLVVETHGFGFEDGYSACRELWSRDISPTAIVAFNDVMAMGALTWFRETGVRVPQDVSVAGFDGTFSHSYQLTTVNQLSYEQGFTAVQMLVSEICGQPVNPRKLSLYPQIVIGESTAHVSTISSDFSVTRP